jgi:PTS system fructose-specific IIC component
MGLGSVFSEKLIKASLEAKTKEGVIRELTEVLYQSNRINDRETFIQAVFDREKEMSTTLEHGIAIPHAKSSAVNQPSVVVGISRDGLYYDPSDKDLTKIFFLIATPDKADDLHVRTLSEIACKLLEEDFRQAIVNAESEREIYEIISGGENEVMSNDNKGKFIIGVTGCPTGVAHTYLAANSLKKAANSKGLEIKVETNGSIGVENAPTVEEIKRAEAIIVACDKKVDLDRFDGKKVAFAGVKDAIDRPETLINKALGAEAQVYKAKSGSVKAAGSSKEIGGIYKYLMNGVSYMIPFVVIGDVV